MVKYEDLVNKFNETIKSIFDFLELELVDEVYNYPKYTSVKHNNAWSSEVQNIYKTRSKSESNSDFERINSFMRNHKAVKLLKKLNYID